VHDREQPTIRKGTHKILEALEALTSRPSLISPVDYNLVKEWADGIADKEPKLPAIRGNWSDPRQESQGSRSVRSMPADRDKTNGALVISLRASAGLGVKGRRVRSSQ
jgi:hypothetical protein